MEEKEKKITSLFDITLASYQQIINPAKHNLHTFHKMVLNQKEKKEKPLSVGRALCDKWPSQPIPTAKVTTNIVSQYFQLLPTKITT